MTHDELLRSLNYEIGLGETNGSATDLSATYALRRVVEMHKPVTEKQGLVLCSANCEGEYPCSTIQAIEKELR